MKKSQEIMLRIRVPKSVGDRIEQSKKSAQEIGESGIKLWLDTEEPQDFLYWKLIMIKEVKKKWDAQKQINEAWTEIQKHGYESLDEFIEEQIRPVINGQVEGTL